MHLKRSLPPDRNFEQVYRHYSVEREIAQRLKVADREERKVIYATMYDELFRRVPDHPRLRRREDAGASQTAVRSRLSLLKRFLDRSTVFLEFAPGDCRFALAVADRVRHAYAVDISDQRAPGTECPANFELIVYDGYSIDSIAAGSVDVIFSDQLIEHFHPDDARLHFELAYRLLKPDGQYVFRTPHALTGPHDVSMYFSDVAECFHLKEWTYREIRALLADVGYTVFQPSLNNRGHALRMPYLYFAAMEALLSAIPRRYARLPAKYLLQSVCVSAGKLTIR